MKLKVKRLDKGIPMPEYAKSNDAGFDLRATEDFTIYPGETVMVGTGLAFEIPEGYNGEVRARSGMASKRMLAPINEPGTVDSCYRGEVKVPLHNFAPLVVFKECGYGDGTRLGYNNNGIQHVKRGERIAQMVIAPVAQCEFEEVEELSETERGAGGFGSTGA
jgi:dUTP pyrophosphatase